MLQTVALLCLTLMTGNELCVAVFVNPALRKLREGEQIPFLARTASQLGFTMPFWYVASFVLTAASGISRHKQAGEWPIGPIISVSLQVVVLILTIGFMVPINNKLAKLQPDEKGWTPSAVRWDRMHQVRVLLLLIAVAALAAL